ncbi:tetratricopeptide repeat protein [Streptomyces sp. 1331.2]|uniref:tetratricopeptide repeat protein n=1 Tax=Streptomyces sp. 1331.2 TaxID=1938835 RepID=UPI0015CEF941|nr:tetratricopeptide repeat protein [Streptomyces sp. 1331.2]
MARKTATMDPGPGAPAGAVPGLDRLPAGPALFVGRRAELAALRAAAARPASGRCPVLVLAGRPGSGRTALAARFARTVAADYPDGVLFARMSAADGGRVPPARAARLLLEQLDPESPVPLPGTAGDGRDEPGCVALREALAGLRVLLVLDDVRDAGQVWPLLADEPGCLVLATTAGPLTGIEDIDPVILGGLDRTASGELLADLVGGTRISCDPVGAADLAEACAARPATLRLMAGWLRGSPKSAVTDAARELNLVVGEETAAAAGAKDGSRKAGGTAAGKTAGGAAGNAAGAVAGNAAGKALGKAEATAKPSRVAQKSVPESGPKDAPRSTAKKKGEKAAAPGAESAGDPAAWVKPGPEPAEPVPVPDNDPLLGAFALLYRALPAAQARMLRTLTLAPAQTADPRTASALVGCPVPEAAATLAALAERELLGEEAPAADGTPRYRVPGRLYPRLVRLRQQEDRPAETELARARLLERLVRLTESARALLEPADGAGSGAGAGAAPEPLPAALRLRSAAHAREWLLGERELLLGAVADAIGQGDLDGSAGRLVTALLRALPLTGAAAPTDLYRLHELVLTVAERNRRPRRASAALLNLGDLQVSAGRWEQAAAHYRAALEHARTADDEPLCARALEGAAGCHRALGDAVRAADWYGRALGLRQSLGDHAAEARLLARVAEAHTAQRRFDEADREYRAALAVLRRLGDERGLEAVGAALADLRERVDAGW